AIRPKSTIAEIYQLIDEDVQAAVSALPEEWPDHPGRLTRGAALSLQTKTYMARQRFSDALASAQAVISSGIYDLRSPHQLICREDGENRSESILEIQALFDGGQDFGGAWASRQGIRGSGSWSLGWGWNIPHQRLMDAFEPGDPRQHAT